MGQPGLGLTDHATLSGLLHHMKACSGKDDKGKKLHDPLVPICGVEAYYRPDRTIREKENLQQWHMCFWAKNIKGWHNLLRLTSVAFRDNDDGEGGFYGKPCVDLPLMEMYSEGVICSTACISGWLSHCIMRGDSTGADLWIKELKRIYGADLWLEIMPHDFADQRTANIEIVNLANDHSVPLLTGVDAHVPYKDWASTQQIAKMLSTKNTFKKAASIRKKAEEKGMDPESFVEMIPTIYLMEEQEVRDLYDEAHPDLPQHRIDESIDQTEEVMRRCQPFKLSKQIKFPRVTDDAVEAEKILRDWVEEGMERIVKHDVPKVWEGTRKELEDERRDRLEFEFRTIKEKGVIDYFILVGDWVRWMKANKIRVTCRGSAAGCFVSYLIGISPIDSIAYGLLFERFLNPGRKGLPDIDIDIQSDRRDEAIQYVVDKYGKDHVAQIIAHGTFQAKKVVIDVARVYDVPHKEIEPVRKSIDIGQEDDETTLEQLRPINEHLQKFADDHPDVYEQALRLEGMVATASKHAAGVVITDKPVTDYMPLERGKKGDQVTSWSDRADFPAVSDYGFVKLDALGVKGLSKQDIAVQLIKERHGIDLDLEDLEIVRDPLAVEPEVMDIFTKGLTLGIWQFGSRGITNLVKSIKPTWIGDLIAANALYRPGAMGSGATWEYAERKELEPEEIDYWDDAVKPVTGETFGIIAYQEQVMNICKVIGGFSPGQADDMRKAMGKLYRLPGSAAKEFMQGFKDTWDAGVKKIGLDREVGERIWNLILSFGGYGFNKCISGDTVVIRSSGNQHQPAEVTTRDLHQAWHSSTPWGKKLRSQGLEVLQMSEDGRVRPAECTGIHFQGVREVFEITTQSGRKIKVTGNHEMLLADGHHERVDRINVGDELVAMGEREGYVKKGHQTDRARGQSYGGKGFPDGLNNPAFMDGRHVAFEDGKRVVATRAEEKCECCGVVKGKKHDLEFAHLKSFEDCGFDYAVYHSPQNMELLCNSDHKRFDYAKGERKVRWSKGRPVFNDPIVSIERLGKEGVYDLEMDTPDHNFIANGLVSHNSHSACYAVQAYQDAFLKAFYPAEFYVGLLTFPPSSTKKKAEDKAKFLQSVVREADAVGVDIGPPDINKSEKHFSLNGETLRFGLLDIKDVGGKAVDEITQIRPFWNWGDFEGRVVKKTCNAKVKRALVEAGACDRWGMRDELSASAMAQFEKERLGISLTTSGDTAKHRETIEEHVWNMEEFDDAAEEEEVVIGGDVIDVNIMKTKKGRNPGQEMAKVTIACGSNQWQVTFFPQMWESKKHLVQSGSIMVAGKKNVYRNDPSVVANQVISVEDWINGLAKEEELVEA
jgi:DNA-directed DNA polymerase III PolC